MAGFRHTFRIEWGSYAFSPALARIAVEQISVYSNVLFWQGRLLVCHEDPPEFPAFMDGLENQSAPVEQKEAPGLEPPGARDRLENKHEWLEWLPKKKGATAKAGAKRKR